MLFGFIFTFFSEYKITFLILQKKSFKD